MALNIATDVLDLASSIAGTLRHSIGVMGSLHTAALAGPISVESALRAHETLASTIRWADGIVGTTGLGTAFGTRFGSNPATLTADWTALKAAARALLNGLYSVLPKAADGTVQIYSAPDATTAERTLLTLTLTAGQKTSFTGLWNDLNATIVMS